MSYNMKSSAGHSVWAFGVAMAAAAMLAFTVPVTAASSKKKSEKGLKQTRSSEGNFNQGNGIYRRHNGYTYYRGVRVPRNSDGSKRYDAPWRDQSYGGLR